MAYVGALNVDPPLVLAPMAGITDSSFRRMIRWVGGCGLVCMEFVSSEGLLRGIRAEEAKLPFAPQEHPISVQVFGAREEVLARAAERAVAAGADVIDINMGCPARKVRKSGGGAALMGDLRRARCLIRAVRRVVPGPLTVKFRSGLRHDALVDLELGGICQEEGADAVALHPRTAAQQYSGRADWERIARLTQALDIPVIGNGDVGQPEDALRMMQRTGCHLVMIGRAAITNPWIFRQAAEVLEGRQPVQIGVAERVRFIREHFRLLEAELDGPSLLHKLRVFTGKYTHGLRGGRKLRARLDGIKDARSLLRTVESFLEECEQWEADSTTTSHQ